MPKHSKKSKSKETYLKVEEAFRDDFDSRMRSAPSKEPLFFIDKKKESLCKSADERKRTYQNKLTTTDRVLALNPKVPDITTRVDNKRFITPKEVFHATRHRKNKIKEEERAAKRRKLTPAPQQDLWVAEKPKLDKKWEDIADVLADRALPKKPRVFAPKLDIPHMILPEPGQSYRPSAEAHRELMAKAIAIVKHRNEEEDGAEVILQDLQRKNFLLRVDVGDKPPGDNPDFVPYEKPETKRVTRRKRKKMQKKYTRKLAEKYVLIKEARAKKLDQLPELIEEIERRDKILAKRALEKQVYKEEKKKLTPKFGTHTHYVEPLPAVALSSEIAKNLKNNKTLSHPLLDRYQSLIRTGQVLPFSGKPQTRKGSGKSVMKTHVRAETMMTFEEAGKALKELAQ